MFIPSKFKNDFYNWEKNWELTLKRLNRPWWTRGLSWHVSKSSRDRCLVDPRFESDLGRCEYDINCSELLWKNEWMKRFDDWNINNLKILNMLKTFFKKCGDATSSFYLKFEISQTRPLSANFIYIFLFS